MNFLFLSITDWHSPQFGSRQQLALRLVQRGHQVLYVNVPRALHSLVSNPGALARAIQKTNRLEHIPDGPLVYTPPLVLPIYYNPLSNAFNQRWLYRNLKRTLRRLGWQVHVLWTYWANTAHMIGRFDEKWSVYHCIDNFPAVRYPFVPPGTIARMEAEQCRRVDLVIARTTALTEDKARYNTNTVCLPGGVDPTAFDPEKVTETLPEIAAINRPRIGFVGTIDDRVDVALLEHCAKGHPDLSFVFVGPVRSHLVDIRRLKRQANAHFLPPCAHADVPSVIAGFDVGAIPYRVNDYTRGLSPIKLYEYLAMGVPVVATGLPYVSRERDCVRLAETADEYSAHIQQAAAAPPTSEQRLVWRGRAEAHSWALQVDRIERWLEVGGRR